MHKLFRRKEAPQPRSLLNVYAEHYADLIRARQPNSDLAIHYGATPAGSNVRWTTPNGFVATQHFGNYFARFEQDPTQLSDLLETQYAEALAISDEDEVSLSHQAAHNAILPIIKTESWHEVALRQLLASGMELENNRFAIRSLAGDLMVAYIRDTPRNMLFVTNSLSEQMGLDAASLHDLALTNLERMLPDLVIQGGGGRFAARLDRNYDASMILLLDRWRERIAVDGNPVFAIPARDELLICGSNDVDAVSSLAEMAVAINQQSAYALSAALFELRDGALVAFDAE